MNRTAPVNCNSIAENCRSILRERCCIQRPCNHPYELSTFSQQGCPVNTCSPCYTTSTNPNYLSCDVHNLRPSVVCSEKPTYCNTISSNDCCIDGNIAPMKPILNKQTSHVQYLSIPTESCIQMIKNSIITQIRNKVSHEEIALLCCCLPSLIRKIMCKSPWLTPNDIIRWLTADIIKEANLCFNEDNLQRSTQQDRNKSSGNNHEDLSSYQSINSEESIPSQRSTRSPFDSHNNIHKKQKKSQGNQRKKKNTTRTPSTQSFSSQQSDNLESNDDHSTRLSPRDNEKKSKKNLNDEKNSDLSLNTLESDNHSDEKTNQSSRVHIEYPGKKDANVIQDVKKCLAFYDQIREYFDDDVAAMLLKCCLCYGDCSGKR